MSKGAGFQSIARQRKEKVARRIGVRGKEEGRENQPRDTTPTKMDFDAVDAFDDIPDNTELTFEFDLGGRHVERETEIVSA